MKRLERISIEEFIEKCNESKIMKNVDNEYFALRDFQQYCLEFMEKTKYGLVRKDRQAGGTSVFILFMIYKLLYDSDARNFCILSSKMDNSKDVLYRFKIYFSMITKSFNIEDKIKFLIDNRTDVKIIVNDIEKTISTTSGHSENFFRGKQIDYLFGDEITYLNIQIKKKYDIFNTTLFLNKIVLNPNYSDDDLISVLNELLNTKAVIEHERTKNDLFLCGYKNYSGIISLYHGQIRAMINKFFIKYKETLENTELLLIDIVYMIELISIYDEYINSLYVCCKNIFFNGTSCNKNMNLFDYLWFDFSKIIFDKYYINRTSY
jgi:hypothetical protein